MNIVGIYAAAALAEIAGCFAFWGWLRMGKPAWWAALGVLSMLFLLARSPSPETAIPYVEGDGADLARRTGMTAPRFAGVSADGARVTLSAARADPAGTDGRAEDLALEWQADGVTARVRAGSGAVEGGLIRLDGGAEMTTSTGGR